MLESDKFSIKIPQRKQPHNIKIIGVGGGGNNAVDYMFKQGIDGVDFVACNTDMQVLDSVSAPLKVQLGKELTGGEGAGARPEVGRDAAEESADEIRSLLSDGKTKLAFISAGMGGGTGTGAAPVIARVCREIGIISIGVVTLPFSFEGSERLKKAQEGIENLRQHVDSLIVICNDKIKDAYANFSILVAFELVNEVLCDATRAITSLVTLKGLMNLDFADVCNVLRNGGDTVIAQAKTSGDDRLHTIIEETLKCPLLDYNQIYGTKRMLMALYISPKATVTATEFDNLGEEVNTRAGGDVERKLGLYVDDSLQEDEIKLVIIATAFQHDSVPVPKSINISTLDSSNSEDISISLGSVSVPSAGSMSSAALPSSSIEDSSSFGTNNLFVEHIDDLSDGKVSSKSSVMLAASPLESQEEVLDSESQLALLLERGRREEEERKRQEQLRGYSTKLDLDFDNMDNPFYQNSYVERMRQNQLDRWDSPISSNQTELTRDENGNITFDRGNKFVDGNTPD